MKKSHNGVLSFLLPVLCFFHTISSGQANPMGKTWVIFIENSNYETFASLEGPSHDVDLMKSALSNYQIDRIIHKKDFSKQAFEVFFSRDLKKQLLANGVNSLLIWYAGHGKSLCKTSYWVPVDARRDDESTFFNIHLLKKNIQEYSDQITHLLVITDACESGPTFYQAMRNMNAERSCDDTKAALAKSSQVLSSCGYELAVYDSQFTRTFAHTLTETGASCIPIDKVAVNVIREVVKNNQPKPKFGKIEGLKDEDGTFFFISNANEP